MMKRWNLLAILMGLALLQGCLVPRPEPKEPVKDEGVLQLCNENPRYLSYRGEPLVLITSAEHYGAVLNAAFDYRLYLESLAAGGMNYTRIFAGSYLEPVENVFGIKGNTLAPEPGDFISPWVRREGKFDLENFNPAYFERLHDFMRLSGEKGIFVEVTLFSSIYAENAWECCPFHPQNNLQGVGEVPFQRVNTLYNGGLKPYQEKFIREMVRELNEYDHIFFEIQNEPWSDNQNLAGFVNEDDDRVFRQSWQKEVHLANDLSVKWQEWVASVIADEESELEKTHLIAQNICNFQYELEALPPHVSMVNFHYALAPAAGENLDLGGVIGLDETGFMPREDSLYIDQAWRFILSGGGLYNNLDYSFTMGHEQGDWPIPETNPGWGGPGFREKLGVLIDAVNSIPFYEMNFSDRLIRREGSMKQYGLEKDGLGLVFLEGITGNSLEPLLGEGSYDIEFINMDSGERITEEVTLKNGTRINLPFTSSRMAIKMTQK